MDYRFTCNIWLIGRNIFRLQNRLAVKSWATVCAPRNLLAIDLLPIGESNAYVFYIFSNGQSGRPWHQLAWSCHRVDSFAGLSKTWIGRNSDAVLRRSFRKVCFRREKEEKELNFSERSRYSFENNNFISAGSVLTSSISLSALAIKLR